MDISVKALEEAVSIRRQIDNLARRLSSILGGAPARPTTEPAQTHNSRQTHNSLYAGKALLFAFNPGQACSRGQGPLGETKGRDETNRYQKKRRAYACWSEKAL